MAKESFREQKLGVMNLARVLKCAAALLVANGILWAIAGAAFGGTVAVAFPSYNSLLKAGIGAAAGDPAAAVRQLAWDQFYIDLYSVVIGLFAIMMGLTAFKRGEKWAWYATLLFVLNGLITSTFDYLSWGGWYTVFLTSCRRF